MYEKGITMIIKRKHLQSVLDKLQLQFDLFPSLPYQPIPELNRSKAGRASGTYERWKYINEAAKRESVSSALDIGCNTGYFCLELAKQGISSLGIEMDDRFYRLAKAAAMKSDIQNVAFMQLCVKPSTLVFLPATDMLLLLSVWHHWVRLNDLDYATTLLAKCWGNTRKIMFFETGENEMSSDYGLPNMEPSPKEWVEKYLRDTCKDSRVQFVRKFKAFGPHGDEETNVAYRNLFLVQRA